MNPDYLHAKFNLTRKVLQDARRVRLRVDGRHPDADLPSHLWELPHVALDFGLDMTIPDLHVHPILGVMGTLQFRAVPHHCKLPWAAIWGIGDYLWPGEVPEEMRERFHVETPRPTAARSTSTPARLRVVRWEGGPDAA
jgi:hypothetical protein